MNLELGPRFAKVCSTTDYAFKKLCLHLIADTLSYLSLPSEDEKNCPKVSNYPVKVSGSVAAFVNGTPVICGGIVVTPTR